MDKDTKGTSIEAVYYTETSRREVLGLMPNVLGDRILVEMKHNTRIWEHIIKHRVGHADEMVTPEFTPFHREILTRRFYKVRMARTVREAQHHYDYAKRILEKFNITERDV